MCPVLRLRVAAERKQAEKTVPRRQLERIPRVFGGQVEWGSQFQVVHPLVFPVMRMAEQATQLQIRV